MDLTILKGGVRKDLKYPRTVAVPGNYVHVPVLAGREDLNNPFTAVKGIFFTATAVR
jgi:hypothetical protein